MDLIFYHEGSCLAGESGDLLKKQCAEAFGRREISDFVSGKALTDCIRKTDKGKPFLESTPIEFSVSHSGNIWMCACSDELIGLDIQEIKAVDYIKIGKRFFKPLEFRAIEQNGVGFFFRLWAYREAFGKCTGTGFFGQMPEFAGFDGELRDCVCWQGEKYFFTEVDFRYGMVCVLCQKGQRRDYEYIRCGSEKTGIQESQH